MDPIATQNKPYIIQEEAGDKWWCACGQSSKQPYCDGSHSRLGTGLTPVCATLEQKKTVAWCGCRKTKNPPFCDGSHSKV